MEIYVEYALAENFLLDAMLLWLALKTARQTIGWGRICLAAALGAVFAVIFPLMRLGNVLAYLLKFAVGLLLCLISVKGKGIGRDSATALRSAGRCSRSIRRSRSIIRREKADISSNARR